MLTALGIKPGSDSNREELDSLDHLQQTFHHFFKNGAAAERPFVSGEVFKHVIEAAAALKTAEVGAKSKALLIDDNILLLY